NKTQIRKGVKSKLAIITLPLPGIKHAATIKGSRKYFLGTTRIEIDKTKVIITVVGVITINPVF
ncbi:unnamed protein product, partial [marine sediment metagenome]